MANTISSRLRLNILLLRYLKYLPLLSLENKEMKGARYHYGNHCYIRLSFISGRTVEQHYLRLNTHRPIP